MKRRALAWLLILCMIFCNMPMTVFASSVAEEGTQITSDDVTLSGTGTVEDPYLISDVDDWKLFAKMSQNGDSFSGKVVALAKDIDFADENFLEINEEGTVITDNRIPKFSGTFDGKNHTVKNLKYVVENTGKHNIMMFSQDNMWAYIKNLNIEGVTVNVADISGQTRITGLVNRVNAGGMTDAAIKNVHIKNFKVVSENTTSDDFRIGGFAYFVQGSQLIAKDCSITGFEVDVNSAMLVGGAVAVVKSKCDFENVDVIDAVFEIDSFNKSGIIGGFVAQTQDNGTGTTFTDCDVTNVEMKLGSIKNDIGGFVGSIGSVSQFYNCSVTGAITTTDDTSDVSVGGFVGNLGWNGMCAPNVQHEFNNCVADVDIIADNANVGGFIGDSTVSGYPKRFMPTYFNGCVAKGDVKTTNGVAGGFVGKGDRGNFVDCSAIGNVTGRIAGGFWGEIYPKAEPESTGGWSYDNKVVTHTDPNSKTILLEDNTATGTVTGTEHQAGLIGYMKDIYVNADDTLGYVTPVIIKDNNNSEYNRYSYSEGTDEPIVIVKSVAQIGEQGYATLAAAIAAANAGDTITFLADITEDVTINKALTIDGADKTYTGKMTVKADLTVKNVNFDGKGYNGYAIETRGAEYLTVEDCTAKNYGYGFIQLASATVLTTVKDVTISNVNYGVKVDYSGAVVLENVDITAAVAGVLNSNYGGKTITIKDSDINILGTWTRNNTIKTNYVFEGTNTVDIFKTELDLDTFKLAAGATLAAPEGIKVETDQVGYVVAYSNGSYSIVEKTEVIINSVEDLIAFGSAVTGNTKYQDVKVAANPDVVVILNADLDLANSSFAPIGNGAANSFAGTFDGQGHTISNMTLSCNYYRGVGFFRSLANGAVVKNVTFVNANIDNGAATSANHFYGVVAGFSNNATLENVDVKDSTVKCKYSGAVMVGCLEGTTTIKNCDIENVELTTNDTRVAVFGIVGNSATGHSVTPENNTFTNVVAIIDNEVKECAETVAYGTWNAGKDYAEACYVAQIGETKYSTLFDAIAAAMDGDTITLIKDVVRAESLVVNKNITFDLNSHVISSTADVKNAPVMRILGNVTVKSGNVDGTNGESCYAFIVGNGTTAGTLTIESGSYAGDVSAVSVTKGTLNIVGGEFDATEYNGAKEFMINCIDGNYKDGTAVVNITGGTFNGFNPENNAAEGANTNFVADGYNAITVDNKTWTVEKTEVTIGSVEELITFGNAVTNNKEYQGVKVAAKKNVIVKLTADLDLANSGFAPIGNGAANAFAGTFDGQGHTISNMTLSCNYYRGVGFFRSLANGAVVKNVTFVNANIDNGAATGANHFYGVVAGFSNNLTLENVDVKDSTVKCKYAGAAVVGCLEGATTIKNCDIENVKLTTNDTRVAVYGILGNSATGHSATTENNTVTNVVAIIDNEIKECAETVGYGDWNAGKDYAEACYVAQIGEAKYSTLFDAVAAAKEGDTITLIGDVVRVEPLEIGKKLTIEGNGKTYTGQMIAKADLTVKNVNFDGKGYNGYAIETRGAEYLTVEDCTAKNYGYGFIQLASATVLTTVKDVTISNVNYGIKVDYSGAVVIENVDITAGVAGVLNSNYGGKTITIKDSDINILGTWTRNNTIKSTYLFEGENSIDKFVVDEAIDIFKLAAGATLTAPNEITVTTDAEGYEVKYADGKYFLEMMKAKIGDKYYSTVMEAINNAKKDDTVVVMANATESMLMVPAGVTLDLNGKTLEADYVASFGDLIDTVATNVPTGTDVRTIKAGKLVISRDHLMVSQNNSYLPLYDSEEGAYKFYSYILKNYGGEPSDKYENAAKYVFRLVFAQYEAYELMATGTSGVSFNTNISWTVEDSKISLSHTFTPGTVTKFATDALATLKAGKVTTIYTLTVKGLDKLAEGTSVYGDAIVSANGVKAITLDNNGYSLEK